MATLSKSQLTTDINANATLTAAEKIILINMVDSHEDYSAQINTTARNALTPTLGQVIFNTDVAAFEYWNGGSWCAMGQISMVQIDVTAGQMAALNGTPKVLMAAPGAGFAIMPVQFMYRYTYGSAPYDFPDYLEFFFDTQASANSMTSINNNQFLSANRSGYLYVSNQVGDNLLENKSVVLKAKTGNPTTGDGTLSIWFIFSIVPY